MEPFSLLVVLGVIPILLIVCYGKWKQQYWARKGIPQLKPNLLFGDRQPLITASQTFQDFTISLYKNAQAKGGKHLGIYTLWKPEYVLVDLNIIKQILIKDFNYFSSHGIYYHKDDHLTQHLFSLEGEVWKERRVTMSPTFTSGKMRMMFEILLDKANVLRNVIEKAVEVNGGAVIKEIMARFTTDTIASIAFGLDCNSLEQPDHKFRNIGKLAVTPSRSRLLFETIFNSNILAKLGYKRYPKEVTKYFTHIVKETMQYRESNVVKRKDFFQLLLELKNKATLTPDEDLNKKKKFSEQDVINEAFLFYLAGSETSSNIMTFALIELAHNPVVQEKLHEEIVNSLNKNDGKMSYDLIMEMEYLDKIVKETLRKYPSFSDLPRYCTKSYKVPDTDVIIEKGTKIHIPIIGIHRDPKYFPNPEQFDPENFSPERKATRPEFSFIPFGEGPRMCIGMRFGMMQTKLGIVTIVKDFKFSLDESIDVPLHLKTSSLFFNIKDDIFLTIAKR